MSPAAPPGSSALRVWAPAFGAGAVLAAVIGAAAVGLALAVGRADLAGLVGDAYVLGVLRFTVWQALLSAALALVLAIPVARALARRPAFPGRAVLVRLLGLPMVIPVIVGVLGIVAVYGRSGAINDALEAAGLPRLLDIYGLSGILIAHVFFNMPFATRLLLQAWAGVPAETWRQAAQLGMSGPQIFRIIEWPLIRAAAPGIAALIFLLCFTSFAVVLVLGGGPPNATLEVAIYQALRFEFDLPRVIAFAILQVAVCAALVAFIQRLARPMAMEAGLAAPAPRPDGHDALARIGDGVAIAFGAAVLGLPLIAIVTAGLTGPIGAVVSDPVFLEATRNSILVGLSAGALSLLLGAGILATSRRLRVGLWRPGQAETLEIAASLVLVVPPFVIGAGLFVLLRSIGDAFAFGLVVTAIVNALMGLPFVLRILGPPATRSLADTGRLADSLGMTGLMRLRLIEIPRLRRPAALAFAVATALSLGDLGVIALFGSAGNRTLPLHVYQLMGTYRTGEAAVGALALVVLCVVLFVVIERGIGGRGDD
ncbi:MAG: thiamine/thiamine pyrophosphate ABC transporter permease [Azospirillaceae bacterium]